MEREYHTIRKVAWDMLWHAMWTTSDGRETWDRVSQVEAIRISRRLKR